MKRNIINSRECLILPKDGIHHGDSASSDDTVRYGSTISHDDTCVLKEDFNSYPVKCIRSKMFKRAPNVKDALLKKLSDIEKNLERHLTKKEYDGKYDRLLNQLAKGKLVFER